MSERNTDEFTHDAGRRALFKKLGAASALIGAPAVVSFAESQAATRGWDRETDIVIVGSGASGSSAALFAKRAGADSIILDRMPIRGGTSAKSAAIIWVPNNSAMRALGIEDPKQDAIKYMIR
ncbi:MAG: FAD-dependent oxidoreductase, partial [Gammaproteobacteria bacterium]|nr:FAD-dependent oxidoreductase [Gammaproteobacteria bacterium]